MSSDFAEAKAYLQTDAGGSNLYDHLSEVLLKLVAERPADGYELLEHLSTVVKQSAHRAATEGEATDGQAGEAAIAAQKAWGDNTAAVLAGAAESTADTSIQNIAYDSDALEWAGSGIGRDESFRIEAAMKKLASDAAEADQGIETLRFWGKILGIGGDYFVLEGVGGGEAAESTPDQEGPEGVNKNTYWVAASPESKWTRLPHAQAAHILGARATRRFFTGNLDAAVGGHPPFPGSEKEYLRAVIAIITSETSVSPQDFYKEGDGEGIEADPEFSAEVETLLEVGGWSHHVAGLNEAGREKNFVDPEADEAADGPEEVPALRGLDDEAWVVRKAGSSASLRSLNWPGASAVASGSLCVNLYVGYGQPARKESYTPPAPLALPAEADDSAIVEQADVVDEPEVEEKDEEEDEEA